MKKRILALALAGTTAFSVFGAAMSANAAPVYWGGTSSHIGAFDGAYYQSYIPAGDINWDLRETNANYAVVNEEMYFAGTEAQFERLADDDNGVTFVDSSVVYKIPGNNYDANVTGHISDTDEADSYYTNVRWFAHAIGYTAYETTANGVVGTGGEEEPIVARNKDNGKYYIFDRDVWEEHYGIGNADYQKIYVNETTPAGVYFLKDGTSIPTDIGGVEVLTLEQAVAEHNDNDYFVLNDGNYVASNMYVVPANAAQVQTVAYNAVDNISVDAGAGYTTLDAVDPTDIDAVLAETVAPSGVVYLYDYYDNLPATIDAEDFAEAWNEDRVAKLLSEANNDAMFGTVEPVTAYRGRGVREEVMYEWEDFLDNLGISDASNAGLTRWAEETIKNYAYTYYNADIPNVTVEWENGRWDIDISFGREVNLYNFDQLIADIMELAPADETQGAQTSELIYLMQQYNKYVDEGFVEVNPVETDEWGDLLVSLAEAPTEDEFRTGAAYRRYVNVVEDLVEQYEEAETSVAVTMAEEELYDFVTSYNNAYTVTEKANVGVLGTSIGNTYFNTNWLALGEVYATQDPDGYLGRQWESISEYSNAWALYPMSDYAGTKTGAYPGVDTPIVPNSETKVIAVNDSYFWFYNVYDLAYNVYKGNRYQSVIDLMATTLDEAAANLVPTTNSTASDILAAEEEADKLADLIDTDYTAAMWANREHIYSHITDRVSNDEIGRQGAHIAEIAARETASLMGWQKFQTSVTRSEINSVSTAKANAQAALTALRNDEDNYNAAQANALEKAIEDCDYIIELYNGTYSKSKTAQSVNTEYNAGTGDKDQILKSDCTDAIAAVDAAINFSNIIQGWSQDEDGNWMYGTTEGYLNDGWHQVDGGKTWFYFDEDGTAKQSEWWQNPENGYWYWFNSNCGAAVGWAKIDGDWYFFKGDNHMKTGWEKVEGSWYYLASSGKMVTGWAQIDGKWYYFSKESNALGQMLTNTTTPDGYKVDANGVLVD